MKIEQIDLKAYGHFTNQQLRLSGPSDFHIVCGPNEAGKTTLWRAINGALFGIPNVSPDTFLHEARKIRIGLILSARSGERLAVMRRKGRINTLLEYDPATGNESADTVPDERLRDWLGGLSEGLFLAMFSLDHAALLRGGVALAQGKGDAGESLFEAGAGLSSIRSLRARLDREAETLFKPRASTSVFYRTLADYEEARKQAKDAAVRPGEWTAARTMMELARKAYEAARADQLRLQKDARRLERLAAILPDVAALALAQQRLVVLASLPPLPPSASAERIAAVIRRNAAVTAERTAHLRLEQRQGELAAIRFNDAVLADAESIEAIHHATTAYREAGVKSATATAAMARAQAALASVLRQIAGDATPEEALQGIPNPIQAARIRSLITIGATVRARHASDLQTLNEKQLAIAQLHAELLGLGEDGAEAGLGPYLDSIADYGDPQAQAQQLERDAAAATVKLNAEAGALKMPSVDAIVKLTVPLEAEVQRFKTDDDELRRQARSIREAIEKIEDDLAALRARSRAWRFAGRYRPRQRFRSNAYGETNSGWPFADTSCRPQANRCRWSRRRPQNAMNTRSAALTMPPTGCLPMPSERPVTPSFVFGNHRWTMLLAWSRAARKKLRKTMRRSGSVGPTCSLLTGCRPSRSPRRHNGSPSATPCCRSSMRSSSNGRRCSSAASWHRRSATGSRPSSRR
jgi:uncharacterized protein YhaN